MTKAKLPGSKQRWQAGAAAQTAAKPDGPPSEAPNAGAGCRTAQGGERSESPAGRPAVDGRDAVQPEERGAAKDPAPGAGLGMQNRSESAANKEILGIVRHLSEWTKDDRSGDGDWLKADIGKLLKLTAKAVASADKSRTLLNRLPAAGAPEQEPGEAGNRLEEAVEAHTADFHRWSDIDRRRRRWAGLAMAVAVPALFLFGVLVEQEFQIVPLDDSTNGWRGHIWDNYGLTIVDCAVQATRTDSEVDCSFVVRKP